MKETSADMVKSPISHLKGFKQDHRAHMSFSIIAVALLLISGLAVLAVGTEELSSDRLERQTDVEAMIDISEKTGKEVEQMALQAAIAATQADEIGNVQGSFRISLDSLLRERFPAQYGNYNISVNASRSIVQVLPLSSPETSDDAVSYAQQPAFYRLAGSILVNVTSRDDYVLKEVVLDQEVYLPTPLMDNLLEVFGSSLDGSTSSFWMMVRYELTALAQFRLITSGSIMGGTFPDGMLDDTDVENALILSMILEQKVVFHEYDHTLLERFRGLPSGPERLDDLRVILDGSGQVDPADIMLRLYDMNVIDPKILLAHTLYASADRLALRWLDYFHVIDLISFCDALVDVGTIIAEETVGLILNNDQSLENAKKWMISVLEGSGLDEMEYRYLWPTSADLSISVQSFKIGLSNSTGSISAISIDGSYTIDLPMIDVLDDARWGEFRRDYMTSTDSMARSLNALVREMATSVAGHASINALTLTLDPYDQMGPIEELRTILEGSVDEASGWLSSSVQAVDLTSGADPMGLSLMRFLDENREHALCTETSRINALNSLVQQILASLPVELRSTACIEYNRDVIWTTILHGQDPSLIDQIDAGLDSGEGHLIENYRSAFCAESKEEFFDKVVSDILSGAILSLPGLEPWLEGALLSTVDDMVLMSSMNSLQCHIELPSSNSIGLQAAEGHIIETALHPKVVWGEQCEILVRDPMEMSHQARNPNLHITNIMNATDSPFLQYWSISFNGGVTVELSTILDDDGSILTLSSGYLALICGFKLCGASGWPLSGVDYHASNTLAGDTVAFFQTIWGMIKGFASSTIDTIGNVQNHLWNAIDGLSRYSSAVLDILSAAFDGAISVVQGFLNDVLVGGLGIMIETASHGKHWEILDLDFMGTRLTLELNGEDIALSSYRSILKLSINSQVGPSALSVTGRLMKHAGEYCVLVNATMKSSDGKLEMVVDPLMQLFPHLVEVKGLVNDRYVEISAPQIAQYTQVGMSLADIPGLSEVLSNIPLPVPGLKAQINAGMLVKVASSSSCGPVINEYEQNPAGVDAGNEWVEIFNPSGSVISMSGWTLETVHGRTRLDDIGEVLLLPGGRVVYEYSTQALDNGDQREFPFGESIVLRDATGGRVDTAPFSMDQKNDGRSWQRAHDGSDIWEFRMSTKGEPNSKRTIRPIFPDQAVSLIDDIIIDMADQLLDEGANLDSLAHSWETSLRGVASSLVHTLSGHVLEACLYLDVTITDQSGTAGSGLRVSISIDGSLIEEGFYWLIDTIGKLCQSPLAPMATMDSTAFLDSLMEQTYLGIGTYAKLALPKYLGGAGVTFKTNCKIELNLAQVGAMMGQDLGDPMVEGGICLSGIPGTSLPAYLGIKATDLVDVWLIKFRVCEVG